MSVSLNNHEDRIKILENKSSSDMQIKLLSGKLPTPDSVWTYFASYNEVINYDFIAINVAGYLDPNDSSFNRHSLSHLMPVKLLIDIKPYWAAAACPPSDCLYLKLDKTGLQGYATYTAGDNGIWWIYGLKIYYIFRYNIREILKLISPILKF